MPRPSRSVVGLCLVVIVVAAFVPGMGVLGHALVEPGWVLLPDQVSITLDSPVTPADEQPIPLLSLASSRSPPPTRILA
jgi:hypothetical protein